MIQLYHVDKIYKQDWYALRDVNLSIGKGEFVFLTGASGAGKTTLLELLYMQEFPTNGQVIVGDYSSTTIKRRDIPYLRRQLGIIFQDFQLMTDRTVYENLAFALEVVNTPRPQIKPRVLKLLSFVGLSHKLSALPYELSGGEQQRVTIARALINDPVLVLADEPTGNLDPQSSDQVMQLLRDINLQGATVLMATHNTEILRHYNYRTIRLDQGRVVEDRSPLF
ncbi:MAG: cell division ATP-binding protein FtsE [Gemmatimonadetes bacterium]|nr:MAG: cell division ATP-binding protein FtsE [Gemmatimonadota bacterium]